MVKMFTRRELVLAPNRAPARYSVARSWRVRGAVFLVLSAGWFAPAALASDDSKETGRIEGTVVVMGSGHQSYVTGAKLTARGPVTSETETNADGEYAFSAVPPGTYSLKASFTGLEALQTVTVCANQAVHVLLQLRPSRAKTSVTVTASDAGAKVPAPTETITDKTLRDAPNLNERFESLLRPGWVLSHSTWRDEKSVVRWRTEGEHHAVQEKSRFDVLLDYHLRVG